MIDRELLLLAMPAGHRLAGRSSVGLAEVADDAFVSQPRALAATLYDRLVALAQHAGFQPSIVQLIEQVLIQLHQRGIALLLVEQFVDFAVSICDEYVVLDRGSVVERGSTAALDQAVIDEYLAV